MAFNYSINLIIFMDLNDIYRVVQNTVYNIWGMKEEAKMNNSFMYQNACSSTVFPLGHVIALTDKIFLRDRISPSAQ